MKNKLVVVFLFIFLFFALNSTAYDAADVKSKNASELLMQLPIGNGNGLLAYTPDVPEFEKRGPKSFAVAHNGNIYILDTIDNQIEIFDKDGHSKSTLSLPENKEYLDIELAHHSIFVMNDSGEILEYQTGEIANQYKVPAYQVIGLFNDRDNVYVRYRDGTEIEVTTQEKLKGHLGFVGKRVGNHIEFKSENESFAVEYEYEPTGTYPANWTDDGVLVIENEALIGNHVYVETRVGKYKNGRKVSTAVALPTIHYFVDVPHKFLYTTNHGNVYQMVLNEKSVDIHELFFIDGKRSHITPAIVDQIQPKEISHLAE